MDPIALICITGFSARLAKTAWEMGETLFNFTKDARFVNQTLAALARQARAVKDPCELIETYLRGIEEELNQHPTWVRTRHGKQLANVVSAIERQLTGCEETLTQLRASTEGICGSGTVRGAGRAWVQLKLNMSKEVMIETRSQLALHMAALNTSLQILNLNKMIIVPGGSADSIKDSIDALREQILELEQCRSQHSKNEAHQDLLTLAEDTVADGETMHIAALFGDTGWATALIADGADVNHACTISTSDCRQLRWKRYHDPLMPITPLACALLLRHVDMVRLLVSRGSLLTTWGGPSYAVALLNEAYLSDDSYTMDEVLRCLKHLGWNIDALIDVGCSRSRRTMLHHAASILDTENVRHLTSCGASVLVKDEAGNIPLNLAMKATGSAVTKTMSLLLQYKAQEQLDSRGNHGRTPLHYLVDFDNHMSEDAAWILLKAGANPYLKDNFGNTPYAWFVRNRHHWTEIKAICEEYQAKASRLSQHTEPASARPESVSQTYDTVSEVGSEDA